MLFVIENDIDGVCHPGDIVTAIELERLVEGCEFVMVTAFNTMENAQAYAGTILE